jgi:hypothetical protein
LIAVSEAAASRRPTGRRVAAPTLPTPGWRADNRLLTDYSRPHGQAAKCQLAVPQQLWMNKSRHNRQIHPSHYYDY